MDGDKSHQTGITEARGAATRSDERTHDPSARQKRVDREIQMSLASRGRPPNNPLFVESGRARTEMTNEVRTSRRVDAPPRPLRQAGQQTAVKCAPAAASVADNALTALRGLTNSDTRSVTVRAEISDPGVNRA